MTRRSTILLVEDNDNDRMIALRALRKQVSDVRVARDGQEALELLGLAEGPGGAEEAPLRPTVVFLDLKMPRLDGWDVLREMRAAELTRSIPVVVLSASDREEDVAECYRLGANSFLVKQFDTNPPGAYLAEAARYWTEHNRAPRTAGRRTR